MVRSSKVQKLDVISWWTKQKKTLTRALSEACNGWLPTIPAWSGAQKFIKFQTISWSTNGKKCTGKVHSLVNKIEKDLKQRSLHLKVSHPWTYHVTLKT